MEIPIVVINIKTLRKIIIITQYYRNTNNLEIIIKNKYQRGIMEL